MLQAEGFPTAFYLLMISNSNTFVSTVLEDVGITAPPLVSGPPNGIGWGGPILYAPPIGSTPVRRLPTRPRPL
jgi:hypothetical protein